MSTKSVALIRAGLQTSAETLRVLRREAEKFDAPAGDLIDDALLKVSIAEGYLARKYSAPETPETEFAGWDANGSPLP